MTVLKWLSPPSAPDMTEEWLSPPSAPDMTEECYTQTVFSSVVVVVCWVPRPLLSPCCKDHCGRRRHAHWCVGRGRLCHHTCLHSPSARNQVKSSQVHWCTMHDITPLFHCVHLSKLTCLSDTDVHIREGFFGWPNGEVGCRKRVALCACRVWSHI